MRECEQEGGCQSETASGELAIQLIFNCVYALIITEIFDLLQEILHTPCTAIRVYIIYIYVCVVLKTTMGVYYIHC